jgi:hypothetical protein
MQHFLPEWPIKMDLHFLEKSFMVGSEMFFYFVGERTSPLFFHERNHFLRCRQLFREFHGSTSGRSGQKAYVSIDTKMIT